MSKLTQIMRKAQQFAEKNPDKVSKFADKAGSFVNKQTKGKYADKVDGVLNKVDSFTGHDRRAADSEPPKDQPEGGWQVDREPPRNQPDGGWQVDRDPRDPA